MFVSVLSKAKSMVGKGGGKKLAVSSSSATLHTSRPTQFYKIDVIPHLLHFTFFTP